MPLPAPKAKVAAQVIGHPVAVLHLEMPMLGAAAQETHPDSHPPRRVRLGDPINRNLHLVDYLKNRAAHLPIPAAKMDVVINRACDPVCADALNLFY
jgi:hypothetical protein